MTDHKDQKAKAQVIDLNRRKYANLVLDTYDRMEHESKREKDEKRAEVERAARNKL